MGHAFWTTEYVSDPEFSWASMMVGYGEGHAQDNLKAYASAADLLLMHEETAERHIFPFTSDRSKQDMRWAPILGGDPAGDLCT